MQSSDLDSNFSSIIHGDDDDDIHENGHDDDNDDDDDDDDDPHPYNSTLLMASLIYLIIGKNLTLQQFTLFYPKKQFACILLSSSCNREP